MKTIGVIGGIGPQATMDFEWRLHAEAQRTVPQSANSGYPPMVVYYLREIPVAVDENLTPLQPMRPSPRLFEVAAQVGALSDFIVVTSNAPHSFEGELEKAAGKPLLSMVGLAIEAALARSWKRVGVLGMGSPTVYTDRLSKLDLPCETPSASIQGRLDRAIIAVLEGRADGDSASAAGEAVYELMGRGAEGVILGCTEIPMLLGPAGDTPTFINPIQLLAEAAMRMALEE